MRILVAVLLVAAGGCLAGWPIAMVLASTEPVCWSCGLNPAISVLTAVMLLVGLGLIWAGVALARPRRS
jgi:hypothetical protein